jgi:hypothetical protein
MTPVYPCPILRQARPDHGYRFNVRNRREHRIVEAIAVRESSDA